MCMSRFGCLFNLVSCRGSSICNILPNAQTQQSWFLSHKSNLAS
uniref:Uncharacterized protein n=1 Tax=Arundo donax TaxID=35708 RepID=A0A0A9H3E5_ARUDO